MRIALMLILMTLPALALAVSGDAALGTRSYDDYERPEVCESCHTNIYRQWEQAMMSQAYTHHWDEIEYFELAVPHAEKDEKVAGVKAGCNGCHAPIAFLAGDVPPPKPEENSRANESVSCDLCHTVTGFEGDTPFNFNWVSEPGEVKYGPKDGVESPHHETQKSDFLSTPEFCGTCHNEMSLYDQWVKSTHLEYRAGPYAAEGVRCHDCHMPKAIGTSAQMGEEGLIAQHLFHGAHDPGKLAGAVELRMHPDEWEVPYDGVVQLSVQLFGAKAGHKIPTGSVEDRIFRMAYYDPQGRMTIQQWNTAFFGPDYRIGPRETKIETFTWEMPDDVAMEPVKVTAVLNYQKLITPVGEFLGVPAEEMEIVRINTASTEFEIYD